MALRRSAMRSEDTTVRSEELLMTTLIADIKFGVRMLFKSPMMTFVALFALTLGIGANTAIFSVVNAVLLRSFPYADPERLALVWEKRQGGRTDQNVINLGNFSD